jgi:hypothetical protein
MRAPRTAVAVSADGNTLWLTVVDGWRSSSLGLMLPELAAFLEARNAHAALALDGGSSSTLVIDGALASSPSDGVERPVANHLGIKFGALPKITVRGLICSTPNFTACNNISSLQIDNATVVLDDGRVRMPSNPAEYIFTGVTPRYLCVTASKTGYQPKTKCKQQQGDPTYNSIDLQPTTAPTPEPLPPLAAPEACADGGVDAGTGSEDPPGCCSTGDRAPRLPSIAYLMLVALVALMLTRRRGTKA